MLDYIPNSPGLIAMTAAFGQPHQIPATQNGISFINREYLGRIWLTFLYLLLSFAPLSGSASCGKIFENHTLTWIVPHGSGGGYDTYSRILAPLYAKYLNTDIAIINEPGAGGRIGAGRIKRSKADGLVVGIINGPGLIAAALSGDDRTPNPTLDFEILGRVAKNQPVLAAAKTSAIGNLDDLLNTQENKTFVGAVSAVGSVNFVNLVVVSQILEFPIELVSGYKKSSAGIAAAMRGEVDLVAHSLSSTRTGIIAGELIPLLQIGDDAAPGDPLLQNVPVLTGKTGAVQKLFPGNMDKVTQARGLVGLMGAGRLLVAPLGIEKDRLACMQHAMWQALNDEEFARQASLAHRPLDIADAKSAAMNLKLVESSARKVMPIIKVAGDKARQ